MILFQRQVECGESEPPHGELHSVDPFECSSLQTIFPAPKISESQTICLGEYTLHPSFVALYWRVLEGGRLEWQVLWFHVGVGGFMFFNNKRVSSHLIDWMPCIEEFY